MKTSRRNVLVAGAAGVASVLARPVAAATGSPVMAFTHATVIDPARWRTVHDATILVRGDRIEAVGRAVRVPDGARVVDLRGKYVIPGLADMHVHTEFEVIQPPLFLANGVTTVRETSGSPRVHDWRARIEAGTLLGPRWTIGSTIIDGTPTLWDPAMLPVIQVADGEQARAAVREQAAEGADFIKVYTRLSSEAMNAIADESRRLGVPFAGHCPDSMSVADVVDLGIRSIEHTIGLFYATSRKEAVLRARLAQIRLELGDYNGWFNQCHPLEYAAMRSYGPVKARVLFERMARRRTRIVPTLVMHRGLDLARELDLSDPRRKYVPARTLAELDAALEHLYLKGRDPAVDHQWAELFEARKRLVRELHQAGVRLMVGTDTAVVGVFAGFSVHDEMALFVDAGLSPMDALYAATAEPAEFLGSRSGRVAPGCVADLVVLDANPLHDIRNTQRINGVLARDTYYDHAARTTMLADVERAAADITGPSSATGCDCHRLHLTPRAESAHPAAR